MDSTAVESENCMPEIPQSQGGVWRLIASLVVMHGCFIYFGLLFRKWGGSFIPHLAYLGLSLTVFALAIKRPFLEPFRVGQIVKGVLSAVVLYGVFFAGNAVLLRVLPSAGADVMNIYNLAGGMPPLLLASLLAFPIAFGEEIFWRGCLQKYISERWSPRCGLFLTVTAYTLAHVASKNIMLIGAAAVCGIFWGYLYYRTNSILICIISHMIWDPMIFVLLPIR